MAKKRNKKERREQAGQDLARAQAKFQAAQDRYLRERERGRQEIEKARMRAERWLSRAEERLERRGTAVARAEARVAALEPEYAPTPEKTVEVLAEIEEQADTSENGDSPVVIRETILEEER